MIRACVWSAVALLASSAIVARQSPLPEPQLTDVYVAGEAGYHTFRIPSVIATQKGTLLAFAEARRGSAGDAGDIDLVVKRSRDGGQSWSPLQIVGDNGPNTFGNPCPVLDRNTGTLWLLSTHNRGTDSEKDIIAGTSQASRTVWVQKTSDDGESWSAPVEITASVKQPDWTWYATGPGVGIQTSGGRLVVPANHAEWGSGVHRSHVFYSDDGGQQWRLGASADAGTNESQIVELADGRLMLNMRNHPRKPENFRMVATSNDLGRTFSKASPDRALVEPPAQASLLHLTSTQANGTNRLLFANPASTARERLTVRLSYDEGATWPVARGVHEGPAAYSTLVALAEGSIGLLFERGDKSPYERITFARFTLEWLTEGRDRIVTARTVRLPDVPDRHGFAGAFAGISNGHLLAGGGANFPDGVMPWAGGTKVWHDRMFALDLRVADARWRAAGNMPVRNGYGVSLTLPEGVLMVGGGNATRNFGAVWLVNLNAAGNASFRALPSLPVPLAQLAGALVGRHAHVAGGIETPDATTASSRHWRLDLDAIEKGWQELPALPASGRILSTGAGIGDSFYLVGGCSLAPDSAGRPVRTYLREVWRFSGGTWTRVADLPRASAAAASPAPVAAGSLFVVSGDDGAQAALRSPANHRGFTSEILRYDTSEDRWYRASTLGVPAPVTLPTAPWQDDFIFFNGEIRPGVRTPQVFRFHPER
jgi:N-acetylneuraminic acid mutarotase